MNVRLFIHRALIEIVLKNKYSNLYLQKHLHEVDDIDRSFATQVIYGTLQHNQYCKYMWSDLVDKEPKKEVSILLNMSIYQIFCMDHVPEYAIIHEAVDISKTIYGKKVGNFVNAILNQVAKRGKRAVVGTRQEQLSITTSCPLWLIKMWDKQYGEEVCEKLCFDTLAIPRQMVRVNTLKVTKEELLKTGNYEGCAVAKDALIYKKDNVIYQQDFIEGLVTVQDAGGQLIASFLDPQDHERVLDMCSAPGSKATQLAALMHNTGTIVALELHEHRVKLVKQMAARLGCVNIEAHALDATKASSFFNGQIFDRILLDVPCSGYGVLKRKSDIKVHMQSNDMDDIICTQQQLLEEATKLLKEQGTLVYSTCTLNKKENELQIEHFLNKHSNYQLIAEQTIYPYQDNCDGFYMAKVIKVSK